MTQAEQPKQPIAVAILMIAVCVFIYFAFFFESPGTTKAPANVPTRTFQTYLPAGAGIDPQFAHRAVEKVLKACPGLNYYADDFTTATISKAYMTHLGDTLRLMFKVANHPALLPAPLNRGSAGHNCYIDVNTTLTEMYIGKRACHSICTGKWGENDLNSMGRTFYLD